MYVRAKGRLETFSYRGIATARDDERVARGPGRASPAPVAGLNARPAYQTLLVSLSARAGLVRP